MDIKTLYPMGMEEFLLACGEDELVQEIRRCFENDSPMPLVLHEVALRRWHGGERCLQSDHRQLVSGVLLDVRAWGRGGLCDSERNIIPIEVKAAEHTKAKSLGVYIKTYTPQYAIKAAAKNFDLKAVFCV